MSRFFSRREALRAGALTGAAVALGGIGAQSIAAEASATQGAATPSVSGANPPMLTKAIPSTGEKIPVVGLGTNQFGVDSDDEIAARRDVLKSRSALLAINDVLHRWPIDSVAIITRCGFRWRGCRPSSSLCFVRWISLPRMG